VNLGYLESVVHRHRHPALVICLAMVLAVALVSGMTDLACALVVPAWTFAALLVVESDTAPEPATTLPTPPIASVTGPRAPPALLHL
jgi:hypothetical protein